MGALGVVFALADIRAGVVVVVCAFVASSVALLLRVKPRILRLRSRRHSPTTPSGAVSGTVGASVVRQATRTSRTEFSGDAPTLSIVMPVHNVAPYLESALLSVLYQEFQDFELIIVDDASTDSSRTIIDMYADLDERIRVLVLEHNSLGGAGIPSNLGVRAARGTYLGFVDSDDVVMRGAFAKLVATAEREDAEVVIGGFATFTDDERVVSPAYDIPRSAGIPRDRLISATSHPLLLELSPVPWRKLYRMSFIEKFGIEYPEGDYFFEDNPLHWAVLSLADRVVLTDDVVSHHRMGREGQTMGSMDHRKGALAHHLTTALQVVMATPAPRRDALLSAFVDRLYGSRWVIRQQSHPGAQAMLAKRFGVLFERAVAAGARVPAAMRQTVDSYRGSYPALDLTVVVTAFNCASKVRRTLDSLLAARRIECDILVVDDGSTDNTLSVLRDYESAHANVHVFSQPHRGTGRAHNSVIPLITGRYALFLDAGDRVVADALSWSVEQAGRAEIDLLFFGNGAVSDASLAGEKVELIAQVEGARQGTVAWNRLVRTTHLQDENIFFGGSQPYEGLLFHWHTVASSARIGRVTPSVVERTKFTRKRSAKDVAAAAGDALHDSIWFTQKRLGPFLDAGDLRTEWLECVADLLAVTRAFLPSEAVADFDSRSADLQDDVDRRSLTARPEEDATRHATE